MDPNYLEQIKSAMVNRQTLMLNYKKSDGTLSYREVEPYEIKGDRLWAFDISNGSIKHFKSSGVLQLVDTGNSFVPKHPFKIDGVVLN